MLKSSCILSRISVFISLILSGIFADSNVSVESFKRHDSRSFFVSFGNSVPTNTYDDYGSNGSSFKLVYENSFKNKKHLRYAVGWHNIAYSEHVVDYYHPDLDQIREGERANLFDLGLKLIANDGIANKGFFRPYISASIGLGYFKQYTKYDGPNQIVNECDNFITTLIHIIFDDDCDLEVDYNINTVIDDRMTSSFATIDIGTSVSFNEFSPYSIEFGVRYNIVNKVRVSDWTVEDVNVGTLNELMIRKLQADYKTYFIGFSWYLPNAKSSNKKNNRKRHQGRML